ncbi:MAG: ATP-binding protein [Spirochaetaceae bacterium]|jgi:predicted ATPase|nr:ATP-binding protein [Spirochaetaceae bacterium]
MTFKINNICKIQEAAIEMRGITVIAGNNNTGKSTYGKILYCMFNAFCNAESAIRKERRSAIENIIDSSFSRYRFRPTGQYRNLVNNIIEHLSSMEKIRGLLAEVMNNSSISMDGIEDAINIVYERIARANEITDEQVQKTILTRFLVSEFGNRIIHVNHAEAAGTISLTIKGNTLFASIENNECTDFTDNVGIVYNALYIDTPFILDELYRHLIRIRNKYRHHEYLLESLSKSPDGISAIDEILAKQKVQRVLSNIRSVVSGEFRRSDDGWMFQEDGLNSPLGMVTISAGMKPFLIIKRLMEAGAIKEQGVLVFDEPEIHLHPEWQLKYAELLVILQKEFNLTILLTTHSPYFLNAIEVYSQKNDIVDHCNYYLTDTQGDVCTIQEVTGNLDLTYQKLAEPFQVLENLRYREY